LTSFLSVLPVYGFQTNWKLFVFFIVSIRDFSNKLRYLKSQISTKFHRLLFLF